MSCPSALLSPLESVIGHRKGDVVNMAPSYFPPFHYAFLSPKCWSCRWMHTYNSVRAENSAAHLLENEVCSTLPQLSLQLCAACRCFIAGDETPLRILQAVSHDLFIEQSRTGITEWDSPGTGLQSHPPEHQAPRGKVWHSSLPVALLISQTPKHFRTFCKGPVGLGHWTEEKILGKIWW